jgi:hypothetical protein
LDGSFVGAAAGIVADACFVLGVLKGTGLKMLSSSLSVNGGAFAGTTEAASKLVSSSSEADVASSLSLR